MSSPEAGVGIKILRVVGWFWGGFLILAGALLVSESGGKAVVVLTLGVLCLPPVLDLVRKTIRIPRWIVYVLSLVSFALLGSVESGGRHDEMASGETPAQVGDTMGESEKKSVQPPMPEPAKTAVDVPQTPQMERVDSPPEQTVETTASKPKLGPDRPAPPFKEIRGNMETMTDLQWDRYTPTLVGTHVEWTGWVENVKKKFLGGGYYVQVDMDPPDALSVYDLSFDVSEENALKLGKDCRLKFDGRIVSVDRILGSCHIELDDVRSITLYQ